MRYMVEGGKTFTLLDEDQLNSRIGQEIQIRSPLYCLNKKYCSKCMGQLYYRMGINNVGLLLNRITSNVLNKSLKKFHDLTVKITDINILDEIQPID